MYDNYYDYGSRDLTQMSADELNQLTFWMEALSLPNDQLARIVDQHEENDRAMRACLTAACQSGDNLDRNRN